MIGGRAGGHRFTKAPHNRGGGRLNPTIPLGAAEAEEGKTKTQRIKKGLGSATSRSRSLPPGMLVLSPGTPRHKKEPFQSAC